MSEHKDTDRARACLNLPMVQQHVHMASEAAADYARTTARDAAMWGTLTFELTSPIEIIFYAWWHVYSNQLSGVSHLFNAIGQKWVELEGQRFRVDFQIVPQPSVDGFPLIAVELDGHEFHERTKEQVAYRNTRDRALLRAGWTVLHFSGSELVRDPKSVVLEVLRHSLTAYNKLPAADLHGLTAEKHAEITISVLRDVGRL